MNLSKQFASFTLIMLFVVSCQSSAVSAKLNTPFPTSTFLVSQTPTPSNTSFPSVTPTAIPTESFLLYGGALMPQAGQIYKLETETSSYQRLWMVDSNQNTVFRTYSGRDMDLSPNLQFGAYISDGDIWLLDIKSGKQSNLTKTPDCFEDNTFSWSPDSTKLSYFGCPSNSQLDDLYIIDIFSGKSNNLTNTPDKNENLFIRWWEAQPKLIFFGFQIPKESILGAPLRGQCHTSGGECLYFLASIRPNGTDNKVIDNVSGVSFPPSLSPDGKVIAYDGGILYNLDSQIYQVNNPSEFGISPNTPVNIDGLELVQPVWSPSGKQIVWLGHVASQNKNGTAIYLFDLISHTGKIIYSFNPCYFSGALPSWQRWTELRVSWSQDEQFLAIISDEWGESSCEYTLQVFDKDSNIIQRYEGVDFRSLLWSPDSIYLAFRYFIQSNKRWITLVANINDWQLHPLDIPENTMVIKW
jgi:dipeptidyl aminopeptidase/acylaminoacyl peptidase